MRNDRSEFTHVYTGLLGSVHDMRVFRYSGIQQKLNEHFFPPNTHIIGDKAYTCQEYLITPYEDDGNLTVEQTHFNYVLSSARITVERAIGLLKLCWRYFRDKLPIRRTDLIPYYILAICVLHNICLQQKDYLEEPIKLPVEEDEQGRLDVYDAEQDAGEEKLVRIVNRDVEP